MTLDELRAILVECVGAVTGLDGDFADVDFDELGIDSLVVMETTARVRQRFGVVVPDDATADLRTPAALLDAINAVRPALD
ncbi:acyl carrier protein [Amycolatopsis sp. QT-25]|uniref:acyl carrier protein n=1 Tax=Amycolatopsis sp. QT-25 TaxID=3034022 RepID=UPI0023EAC5FE|nr:acyl carrier protein [Amycolatopsis sp. QT-25]WET83078.1 acyl carrier protein [Amycolatopsis sp. QT-25]